jgi:DNA-binding CsgD family transcriptional regulator
MDAVGQAMTDRTARAEPRDAALPFWTIFDQSKIPMAILDAGRRYVRVNDALVDFWQYPRAQLIGRCADTMVVAERGMIDARWQQLAETGQLYGERVIEHAGGSRLRTTYAAHVIEEDGCWQVLVVTLSARLPDGAELIASAHVEAGFPSTVMLTPRERDVVRLVALGANTKRMAEDLSLSSETVRTHVRNAMAKTGAHTRAQLVALALSGGLIDG